MLFNNCFRDVMKLTEDSSVDMILTDPPFGQNLEYGRGQLGTRVIKGDQDLDWLPEFATEAYRVLKDNTHCVMFWQWRTYPELAQEMIKAGFVIRTVGIWDKKNAGLSGGGLAEQYEQIVVFKKGDAKQNFFRGNVFRYARESGRPIHPHQKPIPLLGMLISLCSKEGDLIMDPFMGSGSTGVAAVKLQREFIGGDLDDIYYQMAKRRILVEQNNLQLFCL